MDHPWYMEANRDEGLKCLELSQLAFSNGDRHLAIKYAQKAERLYKCEDTESWLQQVCSIPVTPCTPDTLETPDIREDHKDARPVYSEEQAEQVCQFLKINSSDYYAVLEISKEAEPDEIKRAYKKMALKFHPDKNQAPGADEAFKAVGAAFACLSNPSKRRQYDMFGVRNSSNGHSQQAHQNEIPIEELFNMFFNTFADEGVLGGASFTFGQSPIFLFNNLGEVRRRKQREDMQDAYSAEARRRRQRDTEEDLMLTRVLQLLPLMLILVLSMVSSFLWPEK